MSDYQKFISEKRRAIETPPSIANKDGTCNFGTFLNEFDDLDFLKIKKPTRAPQFLTKYKLTKWQAVEIHLNNGIFLAAICHMGLFGLVLNVFFDKTKRKVFSWTVNLPAAKTIIAPNLLYGAISEGKNKKTNIRCINNLENGTFKVFGEYENGKDKVSYDYTLNRISLPSIVSIPFGTNRPLYSQKDFFKASGMLKINEEKFVSDDNSVAILDDHRGFYPRKMHFDWVTTLGRELNEKNEYFALNLTQNQSIAPDDYNENLIWRENKTDILPAVYFSRNIPTKEALKKGKDCIWHIGDKYDMVNVDFHIEDAFRMEISAVLVKVEYYIVFGSLSGYVRTEDGMKVSLDGLEGMGEDKTMLF